MYDMLHTDAKCYIIMCKLVKLAFCLCCEPIDLSNMGFHKSTLVARGANTQIDPSCVFQRLPCSLHKSASVHTRFYVDRFFLHIQCTLFIEIFL